MSDSDSDEAFESADEGEDISQDFHAFAEQNVVKRQDKPTPLTAESEAPETHLKDAKVTVQSTNVLPNIAQNINLKGDTSVKNSDEIENVESCEVSKSKCNESDSLPLETPDHEPVTSEKLVEQVIESPAATDEKKDGAHSEISSESEDLETETNEKIVEKKTDPEKRGEIHGEITDAAEKIEHLELDCSIETNDDASEHCESEDESPKSESVSEHGKTAPHTSEEKCKSVEENLAPSEDVKHALESAQHEKSSESSHNTKKSETIPSKEVVEEELAPELSDKVKTSDKNSSAANISDPVHRDSNDLEFSEDHFVVNKDNLISDPSIPEQAENDDVELEDDSWDVGWEINDDDIEQVLKEADQPQELPRKSLPQGTKPSSSKPPADVANPLEKLASANEKSSGWGWSGWGSSILSTATASVSTFTDQVGQGLGSVIESVESTLGAPSPEEMAAFTSKQNENKAEEKQTQMEENESAFKLGTLFTGVSSILETTGSKVLEGGVGALETIGKKTIDILTEGDPGLKKKRAMLSGNRPVLSQILRQAKEQTEKEEELVHDQPALVNFPMMFDKYNGLMYLEALEMLSEQCRMKVESRAFLSSCSDEVKDSGVLDKIEELCSCLPDHEDGDEKSFNDIIKEHYQSLNIHYSPSKLIEAMDKETKKSKSVDHHSAKDGYESAISAQANLTAVAIEQLHKMADLILIDKDTDKLQQTETIIGIAVRICFEIEEISTHYAEKLLEIKDSVEDVNNLTTNIYFEMSNSTTYIHDAVRLMSQVLKLAVLSSK